MLDSIRRNPARVVAAVGALIGLLTAFGLVITEAQVAAIVAAVGAVLALIGGEVTRAQVTPARFVDEAYVVTDQPAQVVDVPGWLEPPAEEPYQGRHRKDGPPPAH